jgi:hypothetical protein
MLQLLLTASLELNHFRNYGNALQHINLMFTGVQSSLREDPTLGSFQVQALD